MKRMYYIVLSIALIISLSFNVFLFSKMNEINEMGAEGLLYSTLLLERNLNKLGHYYIDPPDWNDPDFPNQFYHLIFETEQKATVAMKTAHGMLEIVPYEFYDASHQLGWFLTDNYFALASDIKEKQFVSEEDKLKIQELVKGLHQAGFSSEERVSKSSEVESKEKIIKISNQINKFIKVNTKKSEDLK